MWSTLLESCSNHWELIAFGLSTIFLVANLVLIGTCSFFSVHYAEELVEADIIRGVRWLGLFILPGLEIFAFLPILRLASHGETGHAIKESYQSAVEAPHGTLHRRSRQY